MKIRRLCWVVGTLAGATILTCKAPTKDHLPAAPVVVVGIDGASWNAIETLWDRGKLPNLRALGDTGVKAEIKPVASASPVIWTSIATGVRPERHGITGFVVPTPTGDVPVSSRVRRVPAIWNMVSTVQRRVAALGWWASWPAEQVNGVVVTDRAVRSLEDAFWPVEFGETFERIVGQDENRPESSHSTIARQDRALAAVATDLAGRDFDLLMVYFRNVDAESHPNWKYFRPDDFDDVDPERLARLGQRVSLAYEAVDRAIGDLRSAADPGTNFFVLSDHGFRAVKREQYRISLDLDRVLEHLGYLQQEDKEVDWSRTRAATWGSSPGVRIKLLRFGLSDREPFGPIEARDLPDLRDRLIADLSAVTYTTGAPVFRIREPKEDEKSRGADLTVVVRQSEVSSSLVFDGETIPGAIGNLYEITGSHDANTEGIFIASGPDIDSDSTVDLIHSLDVTPTLLYAMSLPVAQDFDGRPQTDLFNAQFRRSRPVETIPSWGTRESGDALTSEADAELLDELRALGYLD